VLGKNKKNAEKLRDFICIRLKLWTAETERLFYYLNKEQK